MELTRLLERRVERPPSEAVDAATIDAWCDVFGSHRPDGELDAAPSVMFTAFVRPSTPPADDRSATGVVLHDELKRLLELPVAIAAGYGLEVLGPVHVGDRLVSVERIAEVGDERVTRFGPGRDWVIEVATSTASGSPVGIERFRMLGYRPGEGARDARPASPASIAPTWHRHLAVDTDFVVRAATANRVWAPAHHRREAAQAAGLPDIILDTSSQVALLVGMAQQHRSSRQVASVDLTMKRPILPGARVEVSGVEDGPMSTVVATVDDREVSRAIVTFAA